MPRNVALPRRATLMARTLRDARLCTPGSAFVKLQNAPENETPKSALGDREPKGRLSPAPLFALLTGIRLICPLFQVQASFFALGAMNHP
jgi:hypothetical protein